MKTRFVWAGTFFATAAIVAVGILAPIDLHRSSAKSKPVNVQAGDVVGAIGSRSDSSTVSAMQARIRANEEEPSLHAQLGLAYLRVARDAADPSKLPLAEKALERSLQLQPNDNLEAFVGMAALSNARHEFSGSVKWSRKAIETNEYNSAAYGLLGDALFELGRVNASDAAYEEMVARRPEVASYVRVSYALQYHRRTRAAIQAMRLALQAAGQRGETAAWVRHQMGDIYAGLGDIKESARQNRIGIAIAPGYVPPTVGLAEAHIARGNLEEALELMQAAAAELPSLEYMITLGDLYRATGRLPEARDQYQDVAVKLAEYRANGVLPDADFTLFYADHGLRPKAALEEAIATYKNRPTAKVTDALAWMLHSLGRDLDAWLYAKQVIRARTRDAEMLFHAGMIARSLGKDGAAARLLDKALELNPNFSLVGAPRARRALASF